VPDIVEQIFTEKGFVDYRINLNDTYDPKEYCVQYRETDFNFVCRLLEQEGICYFFEHEEGRHTMILADSPEEHRACPRQESARYHHISPGERIEEEVITSFDKMQEISIGKFTVNDYNFEMPSTDLKVEVSSTQSLGPGERELYDYPAEYTLRAEGDRLANIRMQEHEAKITTITGTSTCRAFSSGFRFLLEDYYRDDMNDSEYVLVAVSHGASEAVGASGEGEGESYTNSFTCIPFDVPYRPALATPKPLMGGTQTAIVVGPAGEEIYTDEHGRVKVQFHWDREGQYNESSSCWIRVAQLWAGAGWGGMYIPRIGHEVIIEFLEGDPDRPIIIGCVYHGNNRPPYELPAEKTKSVIKSNASLGGGGFNEIRFEDKKGEEQLFIHAEMNQDIRTKKDLLEWVGNDSHLIVKNDQFEQTDGDKHLTVKGDRNEKVDGTVSLETVGDLQEKVGINHALDAGTEMHLKAGMNVVIEAGTSITLKAGGGFVVVGPAGVTISGTPVLINSGGSAGSGSGCSPESPTPPKEAERAEPGGEATYASTAASPQADAMRAAAASGTPLCDT
jgi:type VI secretion system secreted protein VgrG